MNEPTPKYFTIVARIQAKDGCEAAVATELHKLLEPSRRDKGCIDYDMHAGLESPGLFVFYENWESKGHWEAHMESAHLKEWQETAIGLVEDVELMELEKIE
ncbi:MAG: antibiotic biosynthesis monooxygenase [bacterium]|nr:antibiotic biosynthesis monooxygenase [bacterium]